MSKTIVITGANRGLGLELAREYARRGDSIIAGVRNPAGAHELAAVAAEVFALDTGNEVSIAAFGALVGQRRVDVLINNAGIDARNLGARDDERDVLTLSSKNLLGQVRVNAVGPMLVTRALLGNLALSDAPRVINMSSQIASMVVSAEMGRDVGYAVSKAALNMITVKLATRLRDSGVVVVALHPGYLRTDMGGANAPMSPAESAISIAALVDGLNIGDTGAFRRWDNTEHPW